MLKSLQATQRAVELGIQNIILETDAAAIVQALMDTSSASGRTIMGAERFTCL